MLNSDYHNYNLLIKPTKITPKAPIYSYIYIYHESVTLKQRQRGSSQILLGQGESWPVKRLINWITIIIIIINKSSAPRVKLLESMSDFQAQ